MKFIRRNDQLIRSISGKTNRSRQVRPARISPEILESRTVMDGGGGSKLIGQLPIGKIDPAQQISISKPVASNTEVIVAVKGDLGYEKLRKWASAGGEGDMLTNLAGSKVLFTNQGLKYVELKLAQPQSPNHVIDLLDDETFVAWAAPNMSYPADSAFDPRDFTPNDPRYADQWHHPLMKNNLAWDIATTFGQGVTVAVLDDGVTINHEDLASNIWKNTAEVPANGKDDDANGYVDDVNGWDFSSGDNNPNPTALPSHGTPVAGNIAARVNNGVGLAGVAGMATLMPVRFFGSGAWTSSVIAESYVYAVDNGSRILNVSYNIDGFANDALFRAALDYVYDAGAIYMNSAGNNGQLNPVRAIYDKALFVMASDPADKLLSYSNYGVNVDSIASADPVWTTDDVGYTTFSGTSSSTPVASGAMALVWGANPGWTRDQVIAQVMGTSDNVNSANPTYAAETLGYGRINTFKAVSQTLAAPRLGSINGLPAEGATVTRPVGGFTVRTASIYDPATVVDSSFEMRYAGADDTFGTSDDAFLPISVAAANGGSYSYGTNYLSFAVRGSMVPGLYRFSALSGANGVKNPFGTELDGNGDGTAGDNMTRTFRVAYQTGGAVFIDDNRDGQYEGIDKPLAGWTVFADSNGNGVLDVITAPAQNSTNVPVNITDNTTVGSNLVVSGFVGNITSLKVRVNITHTWDSDLTLTLVSPAGTRISLAARRGGSGDNFTNTVFDDNAATAISAGAAPFTGSFRPEQPLAGLKGQGLNGTWRLEVQDSATGDTGSITGWGIDFQYSTEQTTSTDANGIWVMDGLAVGNYSMMAQLPNTTDWAFGTPSTGKFAVSLPTVNSTAGGLNYGIIARPKLQSYQGAAAIANGANVNFVTPLGTTSAIKYITLYNAGIGTIWIDSISTSLPFEILNQIPTSLASGEAYDLEVVFQGTSTVDVNLPLTIKYLDVDPANLATFTMNLNGHSIIPSINGSYIADLNANGQLDNGETAFPGISLFADLNNNNSYDGGTPTPKAATGLPIAIPDNGSTTHPLNVSGITGLLGGITVTISANHTWSGDLAFILVNPSGVYSELYFDPYDPAGTNFNVTFDDNALASIVPGVVPTGTVRPLEPLARLLSGDPNGVWTLYAYDLVQFDSGTLTNFSITFMVGAEPKTVTASDGSYTFYDLPAGNTIIRAQNPPTGVYFVTPPSGVYTTTLAAGQMLTGINFVPLPPNSISGQVVDTNTKLGIGKTRIFNDVDNDGTFDFQAVQRTSATNKLAIRDLRTVSKTVSVAGSTLPVYGVEVKLNIQHRHLGDLVVTLVSPSGVRTKLLNREGGSGQNLVNAIFDDYADSRIVAGYYNYSGRYLSNQSLGAYNLANPNGTWTVEVTDMAIGDTGWFNNFTLSLITTAEATAITNSLGFYTMTQAISGNYQLVAAPMEPGWTQVDPVAGPRLATLAAGQAINGQNFGFQRTQPGSGPASLAIGSVAGSGSKGPREFFVPGGLAGEIAAMIAKSNSTPKRKPR
jgi:subtilisin-like proprotein convertase family protein/subtilisin family serine protease